MAFHSYITTAQDALRAALSTYLEETAAAALKLEPWGPDVQTRLTEYALRGKLIRGAMVGVGWLIEQGAQEGTAKIPSAVLDTGVAMELLQSFLLIHDDIMDQDMIRRGLPSIHAQYERRLQPANPHYGVSMGICAGDVSAFLAMDILSRIESDPATVVALLQLVSREIVTVGLAQMQDVHHGYVPNASTDAILQVYTFKTGRYTFSLPLMAGALLAGGSAHNQSILSQLGEALGRIFQIRDDQLGLFGDSDSTGKPVGSDIRENKKTVYQAELLARLPEDDPLASLFGSDTVSEEQLESIRTRVHDLGVFDAVERLVQTDAARCGTLIEQLEVGSEGRAALQSLLNYNLTRSV